MKFQSAFFGVFFLLTGFFLSATEKAPKFEVKDYEGKVIKSDEILGKKPALLVFWAQWCTYCRGELPKISEIHRKYSAKGLEIIAFNRDNPDDQHLMKKYVEESQFPFHVVPKSGRVPYDYKALTIPFLVLIDSEGNILDRAFSLKKLSPSLNQVLSKLDQLS